MNRQRPLRRAIRARGHFPTEQSALKCLYLVTRSLDPTGTGQKRWTMRWKPALNASRSPSPTACQEAKPPNRNAAYTVNQTDPTAHPALLISRL
ncbi:putative transposase mutator type [Mycobacterium ulcerans str. Harvey]|uniref:Transposase mutator type n=1 Tax=Mycobacterium ulcerans str. Harvey TaxID=1299332 RepID=A0ABN0QW55_MYCUL|nr:putative transposase mutator type [Mycobacterium ulcerans str. Harvey]